MFVHPYHTPHICAHLRPVLFPLSVVSPPQRPAGTACAPYVRVAVVASCRFSGAFEGPAVPRGAHLRLAGAKSRLLLARLRRWAHARATQMAATATCVHDTRGHYRPAGPRFARAGPLLSPQHAPPLCSRGVSATCVSPRWRLACCCNEAGARQAGRSDAAGRVSARLWGRTRELAGT